MLPLSGGGAFASSQALFSSLMWPIAVLASLSSLEVRNQVGDYSRLRPSPAFISGLEKDYPSTVSTIVKTCAKVVPKGNGDASCRLCVR